MTINNLIKTLKEYVEEYIKDDNQNLYTGREYYFITIYGLIVFKLNKKAENEYEALVAYQDNQPPLFGYTEKDGVEILFKDWKIENEI